MHLHRLAHSTRRKEKHRQTFLGACLEVLQSTFEIGLLLEEENLAFGGREGRLNRTQTRTHEVVRLWNLFNCHSKELKRNVGIFRNAAALQIQDSQIIL
jgi:hypothetical protein